MGKERFEYKFVRIWIDFEKKFEKWGKEGWEHCGKRDINEYIFKRKLNDPTNKIL